MLRSDLPALGSLDLHPGPAIVLMNHPAWWDPLVGMVLADRFTPGRTPCAPMDVAQLRRFGFFRRLGLFGIDPQDPRSAGAMREHVLGLFRVQSRPTLWITPQGRFTDVREPIRCRTGSALIAASCERPAVIAVAIEYAFWQDQRPEILITAERVAPALVPAPEGSAMQRSSHRQAMHWHRAMEEAMATAAGRLSRAVIARDPALFCPLLGGASGRINPVYDLWLRLRGRHGAIAAREASPEARAAPSDGPPRNGHQDRGGELEHPVHATTAASPAPDANGSR
jgi:1-acyl-sn-glycerol-3-phosphate acyltransferase